MDVSVKQQNGIVLVAHGGLAEEYRKAIEHVVGPQRGIVAIAIEPNDDRDEKQAEISRTIEDVNTGSGTVIVTDIFGGTPANLSMKACSTENRIIYGANLPMLLKLAKCRGKPIDSAIHVALEAGRKHINVCSGSGAAPV